MEAKNTTVGELQAALEIVNRKYEGNIKFRSLETKGRRINFTLGIIDSHKPGHRKGFSHPNWKDKNGNPYKAKRLAYACWHVHGDFFESLFSVNPQAAIKSGISSLANPSTQSWITIHGGNWQDRNIGSQAYPMMYSEACDCE